jgi:hypothetical protein
MWVNISLLPVRMQTEDSPEYSISGNRYVPS